MAKACEPSRVLQVMLLLVREFAALGSGPFVVVFVASEMPADSGRTFDFLRRVMCQHTLAITMI